MHPHFFRAQRKNSSRNFARRNQKSRPSGSIIPWFYLIDLHVHDFIDYIMRPSNASFISFGGVRKCILFKILRAYPKLPELLWGSCYFICARVIMFFFQSWYIFKFLRFSKQHFKFLRNSQFIPKVAKLNKVFKILWSSRYFFLMSSEAISEVLGNRPWSSWNCSWISRISPDGLHSFQSLFVVIGNFTQQVKKVR